MSNALAVITANSRAANNRKTIRDKILAQKDLIAANDTWLTLPRITVDKVEYIANVWLHTTADSGILEHGDYLIPIEKITDEKGEISLKKGEKVWFCHHCDKRGIIRKFNASSTSSAKRHIEGTKKSCHNLPVKGKTDAKTANSSLNDDANPIQDIRDQILSQGSRRPVTKTLDNFKWLSSFITVCSPMRWCRSLKPLYFVG